MRGACHTARISTRTSIPLTLIHWNPDAKAGVLPCSANPAGTIENNSTYAHTVATASPNQQGKWLRCRNIVGPTNAVNTAAPSGMIGINQSTKC